MATEAMLPSSINQVLRLIWKLPSAVVCTLSNMAIKCILVLSWVVLCLHDLEVYNHAQPT